MSLQAKMRKWLIKYFKKQEWIWQTRAHKWPSYHWGWGYEYSRWFNLYFIRLFLKWLYD